jgi:hypothetical protein
MVEKLHGLGVKISKVSEELPGEEGGGVYFNKRHAGYPTLSGPGFIN